MPALGSLARDHWLGLVAGVAAVIGVLETALRADVRTTPVWFAAPAAALVALPLLGRRRFPFAAPIAVWLVATTVSFVDGELIVSTASTYVAGLAASALLGHLSDGVRARAGLAVIVAAGVVIVGNNPGHALGDYLFVPLGFALAWLAGFALRRRAAEAEAAERRAVRAEREREATARLAVAEERARIARELHDIVAHAVSVMVLQVGAVRHRMPDTLEQDKDALRAVERAGRAALTEVRRLLGAMRDETREVELAPQPSLDGLDALAERVRLAGLPVRVRVEGSPYPLPPGVDVSAYRIVQEGLTNALKHAQAGHAEVTVRYETGGLWIEVSDDGRGPEAYDGHGHGLVGVAERVKVYGGEMSAGAGPAGGFALRARLPLLGDPG